MWLSTRSTHSAIPASRRSVASARRSSIVPSDGLDRAVVDHRVAAVVGRRPRVQQRHQVQVGDAELAQVGQLRAHAGQRPREAVDVGDVADGLLALEPVGRDLALVVEHPQLAPGARRRSRAIAPSSRSHAAANRGSAP